MMQNSKVSAIDGINGRDSQFSSLNNSNTDFINMLAHDRLVSKRISKMESVQW